MKVMIVLPYARILVVDDSRTMRKVIRHMLETNGWRNVDEAADGTEALELARRLNFSLIISDWNMSPMSGLDLLVQLRKAPRTANIPFIMATARAQKRFAAVARDNGATHYLEKPFTADMLMERVRAIPQQTAAA